MADLDQLAKQHDWLTVTYALSEDRPHQGIERGTVGAAAATADDWDEHEVMVCGSPEMVQHTVPELARAGVPYERIRFDEFSAR